MINLERFPLAPHLRNFSPRLVGRWELGKYRIMRGRCGRAKLLPCDQDEREMGKA